MQAPWFSSSSSVRRRKTNEEDSRIDPGKDKTGAALCEESGKILRCEVLLMEHFLASLQKFLDHVPVTECVLGNGTTSASMQKTLLAAYPDLAIHIIDEAHSTEEARQLYWKLHPPRAS